MEWQSIALGVVAVTIGILSWIGQRQVSRIDKLEQETAKKSEVNEMRKELRDDLKEHRDETRTHFNRLFERLDTIVDRLP